MSGWTPSPDGYRGIGVYRRDGRVFIDLEWDGSSGGRNITKLLSMDEETARELNQELAGALSDI